MRGRVYPVYGKVMSSIMRCSSMPMKVACTKIPAELLHRVKMVAHLRSVELQKDVTPSTLIREAIEKYLGIEQATQR